MVTSSIFSLIFSHSNLFFYNTKVTILLQLIALQKHYFHSSNQEITKRFNTNSLSNIKNDQYPLHCIFVHILVQQYN